MDPGQSNLKGERGSYQQAGIKVDKGFIQLLQLPIKMAFTNTKQSFRVSDSFLFECYVNSFFFGCLFFTLYSEISCTKRARLELPPQALFESLQNCKNSEA